MEENNNNNIISSSFTNYNEELDHNVSSNAEKRSARLKLTITPALCNLADAILNRARGQEDRLTDNIEFQPVPEKNRATNFSASSLTIGSWQRFSQREGDLVGKFYYNKKKIVWEILNGDRKSKMEIPFSNITAIKATIHGNEPEELKIELELPPDFAVEAPPQPRKHTIWELNADDFTQSQAVLCRRHVVTCRPGALEKHYNRLMQSDSRLLELSRRPFPTDENTLFVLDDAIKLSISSRCNSCGGSPVNPVVQLCYGCFNASSREQPNGSLTTNAPQISVTGFDPNEGNYANGSLNWNHMGYIQDDIYLAQGQGVISPPSIVSPSPELFLETNNMHPLVEKSWVITGQDNFRMTKSELFNGMANEVTLPIMAMRCTGESSSKPVN